MRSFLGKRKGAETLSRDKWPLLLRLLLEHKFAVTISNAILKQCAAWNSNGTPVTFNRIWWDFRLLGADIRIKQKQDY